MYEDFRNMYQRKKQYNLKNVQVYDVTLRDGEQTPGIAFSVNEKVQIAKMLSDMGVKYIEAGFPVSGKDEAEAVKKIVNLGLNADIYALSRLSEKDIDFVYECGVRHIAIFSPGSDYLINTNLKISESEMIERLKRVIAYAKGKKMYVRFGCEDASRTPQERLIRIYKACIESGVDMVAFADTLGIMTPLTTYRVMCELKQELKIPMAIHCHNDYGLGLANALSAVEAGVEQIHVSMNGLGERTGNVSLEELVMNILIQYNTDLGIDMLKLYQTSQEIYKIAGIDRPFNKPIVGKNNFKHESGIHVNGILTDLKTYQPFPASLIGRENEIILGKHSGLRSVKYFLEKNDIYGMSEEDEHTILSKIKEVASNKQVVTNETFLDIVKNFCL